MCQEQKTIPNKKIDLKKASNFITIQLNLRIKKLRSPSNDVKKRKLYIPDCCDLKFILINN